MMDYRTETSRVRLPGAAFAPPMRSHARRGYGVPGVMHDFGRMSVHPPGRGATLADSSACAGGSFGKNGETGCDVTTGSTVTTIHQPPACYRHCVERHEAVHARDITPCCTRANAAHRAAKSEDAKTAVQDKFAKWIKEDNVDYLECRGYTESAKCGQEYLDKNCGAKKQDAGVSEGISPVEEKPETSLAAVSGGQPVAPAGTLAEDGQDAGTKEPGPEECCPKIRCYWRVSQGRADNVCGDAPKTLTRCPL
jgi:hypothetical protein